MKKHNVCKRVAVLSAFAAWISLVSFTIPASAEKKVTVFAAASLKNALDVANKEWAKETSKSIVVSYAASSALAKQIELGAPADLFISADLGWMAYLVDRKLVKEGTKSNFLGNRIVLIAPKEKGSSISIEKGFDLSGLLGDGKLAMGEVNSVPAGKYGKAALQNLGIWASVEKNVVGTESVRAALALVSRGEASYGIVYQTDAASDQGVVIVGVFPEESHPSIIYPIAILSESKTPETRAYLEFLKSDKVAPFFTKQGFTVLPQP